MKNLRIIGTPGNYVATFRDDGQHNGNALKPCPFCGGEDLRLENTHSAMYWVLCVSCNTQKFDDEIEDAGKAQSEAELIQAHEEAMRMAAEGWNQRVE